MKIGFHIATINPTKVKQELMSNRGNTFQSYTRGKRGFNQAGVNKIKNYKDEKIEELHHYLERKNISPIVLHAPYSFHLVGEESEMMEYILEDLEFAKKIGAHYYVLHPGYRKKMHEFEAIETIKENLRIILEKTEWQGEILIKNMAGSGSEIGATLEEWCELISFHPRVKGALDFARLYASGVDFTTEKTAIEMYEKINEEIGWEQIKLLYINDYDDNCGTKKSKKISGIGLGVIGYSGYKEVLKNKNLGKKIWIIEEQKDIYDKDETIAFLLDIRKHYKLKEE